MAWYNVEDGNVLTDKQFLDVCGNCGGFYSEGNISIPCGGDRRDCPHYKEIETSDYDKEIRNKAIDEFASKLIMHFSNWKMSESHCVVVNTIEQAIEGIKEIAKQIKGEH